MATKYAISTEFSIVDRATAQLNKMSAAGKGFGGVWQRGIADAQARMDAFGKSVAKATKYAAVGAVGAVGAGIVVATKQYAQFEEAVRAAGASYGPAFTQAADFEQKLKSMEKAVRKVARATEFDAVQSANAMKTLARAGVSSAQAIALLPGVADVATTAMTDMDSAVGMIVGSLNTMGMMSDSPAQLAANMTRLSDVMAHTANSADMGLQDVAAAITAGGSFFRTVNNDLNIMSGSLTALAKSSIKGAEAGTALRNIMTNLSAPTNTATKALSKMGIQTQDASGNMLPLPKIIGQFNKAMAGMGDAEKNAKIYAIFGKQNIAAVSALLNTGQSALEEYANKASRSFGTAKAAAEAMRGGLLNQFKVLGSALTDFGFDFVEAFKGHGSEALKGLTEAIGNFNPSVLIDGLVKVVDVVISAGKVLWNLRYVIGAVAGTFVVWRAVTTAAAIVLGVKNTVIAISTGLQIAYGMVIKKSAAATSAFAFATGKAKVAAILFSGAMKIAAAAQGIFNAVMAANPIILIVSAIILLIGVIVVLVGKWNAVTAAVDGFFERMRNMQGIGGIIMRYLAAPFEMVWNIVRGVFDVINAFKVGGFIAGIKMIGLAFLQCLCAPVEALLSMLSNIPVVGDMFAGWNDRMHNWIEGMRSDILAVKDAEKEEAESVITPPPSATDAQASSYSYQESATTNRLEVSMAAGLEGRMVGKPAPVFSIYAGR